MTTFTISILNPDDIDAHVQLRTDFVRDMLPVDSLDWNGLLPSTRDWIAEHLKNRSYITYVGFLDGTVVCGASLLLYTLPPLPGRIERTVGHLLNFFTYPGYRKRGFGTRLIEHIKADAPKQGVRRLFLNAAPMGEPIYRKAGFVEQAEKALVLELE